MLLERKFTKGCQMHFPGYVRTTCHMERTEILSALQPKQTLPDKVYDKIAALNSYVLFTPQSIEVINSFPDIETHTKLWTRLTPSTPLKIWSMESGSLRSFTTYGLSTMIQRGQCP
jgi:hypothetical protein